MSETSFPLTGPHLRDAKARAQLLRPSVRLGKAGPDTAFHRALALELDLRSLAKIKFDHFKEDRKTLAPQIAYEANAQIILFVGNTLTLYRPKATHT